MNAAAPSANARETPAPETGADSNTDPEAAHLAALAALELAAREDAEAAEALATASATFGRFSAVRQAAQDAFDRDPKLRGKFLTAEAQEREARVDVDRATRLREQAAARLAELEPRPVAARRAVLAERITKARVARDRAPSAALVHEALGLLERARALDGEGRAAFASDVNEYFPLGRQSGTPDGRSTTSWLRERMDLESTLGLWPSDASAQLESAIAKVRGDAWREALTKLELEHGEGS